MHTKIVCVHYRDESDRARKREQTRMKTRFNDDLIIRFVFIEANCSSVFVFVRSLDLNSI